MCTLSALLFTHVFTALRLSLKVVIKHARNGVVGTEEEQKSTTYVHVVAALVKKVSSRGF